MNTTYTASTKKLLYYLMGTVVLNLILVAIIGGITVFIIFLVLNILYIIYHLRTLRPTNLVFEFEQQSLSLTNANLLGSEHKELHRVNDLYFTYRQRTVSRFQGYRNVCIIHNEIKTIAVLTPDKDGWNDEEIKNITSDLVKIGTKQITEKYSDTDVLLND
ncbi:MAG: hypothetical protein EAZ15_05260 [Sphingobacteriales bacterium]|nr:MAG: hypothetical protein EAZ15_05260 [Sphingobacteriales bacterium]